MKSIGVVSWKGGTGKTTLGGKGCGFLFKRTGVRLPYYRKKKHKTCYL